MKVKSNDYCEGYLKGMIHTLLANPEIIALVEAEIQSTGEDYYEEDTIKRAMKILK
jgi:hypothetical protein